MTLLLLDVLHQDFVYLSVFVFELEYVFLSGFVCVFIFETLLGLLNCLPAMLVCDPTFVGRPAPGLTQIRANSQISYLLAGECKSTISV